MYVPPQPPMPPPMPPPMARRSGPPGGLGLLLAGPAALAWLVTLVLPTGQTILHSLQEGAVFGPSRFVGLDNYSRLLKDDVFWKAVWLSVSGALLPCLVAVAVAPMLALALDAGGPVVRRTARVLVSVPLVVFSPVAYAFAQWRVSVPGSGGHWYIRSASSWPGLDWQIALASLGVVCGLVILFALAAAGGRAEGRRVSGPMLLVALLAGLTTAAVALQAFTFSYLSGARETENLATVMYRDTFEVMRIGDGSAVATVIGLAVGVLGLVATVIVISTRLRLAVTRSAVGPTGQTGAVLSVLALLVTVGLLAVPLIPWVVTLFANGSTSGGSYVATWGPALVHALVAVGVAFLAALGISAFRPLGARSEWLLLPLAPWLFVGMTPLAVQGYFNAKDLGLLNTLPGLIPPILVSVPALLVLTLFFRGQSARWRAAPTAGFFEGVVVPSLPLAGLLVAAVTLVDAQDLLWPLISTTDRSHQTMPVAIAVGTRQYVGGGADIGVATPWLIVIPALLLLIVLQFRYLDRLVLTAGERD